MRKFKFKQTDIPAEASEALMGGFAVEVSNHNVAVFLGGGVGFIVSLSSYTEDPLELKFREDDLFPPIETFTNADSFLKSRHQIAAILNQAQVSPSTQALRAAAPLCGRVCFAADTTLYRFTSGQKDICFSSKDTLRAGTYLTTEKELSSVNSGFSAVGRFSLPCPYPASHLHQYVIPKGTKASVGTVEPQFQQSGGGVEIKLDIDTKVTSLGHLVIGDY